MLAASLNFVISSASFDTDVLTSKLFLLVENALGSLQCVPLVELTD